MEKIVVFLMCLISGAACLTGCAKNEEAFVQKSYTAKSEEITEVTVDVRDRQIEVFLSEDNLIHIDYFENSKEYYDISISDDHTLTMTAQSDKEWTDYVGGKSAASSRKISLHLPDEILTSLKISTTNERIFIPAMTIHGDILLSSQRGDIVFDHLNVEKAIGLHGKNGNISGTIVGSYNDYTISCDIKKGKSNLPSIKGDHIKTLMVSNNNGDVSIEFLSE